MNSTRQLCAALPFLFATAAANDWPTYRYDSARSGVTPEKLATPLIEAWVFHSRHAPAPAWEPPRATPIENLLELPRVRFDDAYHVVAAGDALYFGSSADNKVYCLETGTGRVRWTFFTGGPVRLAPTVVQGRVYVGSDDGCVYCLAAADGALLWQRRVGPGADRLLGHGKMISRWPIRTGVLVDNGVAYYGAGLFPSEGVYVEAVRAADGQLLWRNDTGGEATASRQSPQGYLLATSDKLFVPQGRATPAMFDRQDGHLINQPGFGKTIGGTDALLVNNTLYTGTEEIMGYDAATRTKVAWFDGRKVIISPTMAYLTSPTAMLALERKGYAPLSSLRFRLRDERAALANELALPTKEKRRLTGAIAQDRLTLGKLNNRLAALPANAPDRPALQTDQANTEQELQAGEAKLVAVNKQLATAKDNLQRLDKKLAEVNTEMAASIKWRLACACPDALIQAGDLLIAGGQDHVIAVNAATGAKVWESPVSGKAKGLAVAAGRLYVSTDTGAIHCFSAAPAPRPGRVAEPTNPAPYPPDGLTATYAAAADTIVRESGVTRGYCLVLGCETGRLALELARRTNLHIIGLEPDAQKVAVARRALDAAGVYGTRVIVDQGPLDRLPYASYFANLIVSDSALFGRVPAAGQELERVLKPMGGVAMLGPAGQLKPSKITRGPLPGAGAWTHEYANAANTACGDDTLLKCPLGLLWFGDPGPQQMVSRHIRAAGPVSVNGVLFVQSEHAVTAYDAYNGLKLWDRSITNVIRTGVSQESSNIAADTNNFYVVTTNLCLRLDLHTGALKATYKVPAQPDGKTRRWGHLAIAGGLVIGSGSTNNNRTSDLLFAYDTTTDQLAWTHTAGRVPHTSISVAEGRVFFAEAAAPAKPGKATATVFPVIALDLATGKPAWRQSVDLTGCLDGNYWGALGSMVHDGVLVLFGVYTDGHYWKQFFASQFDRRRILTLNVRDGSPLWSKNIAYRVRPLIIGDTLHAEPWAFDLHTGEQRLRTNPITGRDEPWQFARPGHHCGTPVAAPNIMFFRSYYLGYYDLYGDYGTMTFGGQRPGCWINFIAANGLALMPEASAGCLCPFPNMCTVVFAPRDENRAWAEYSLAGDIKPVQHLALHLGAPGDRRDEAGTLWLAYPRPKGHLVLQFKLDIKLDTGGGYFAHSPDFLNIAGTASPWLYTFGCRGLRRCEIPLLRPEDGKGRYTVRLGFAEIEDRKPGDRVFDVVLQGQTVLKNFDVVQASGGCRKALIKEFTGIDVADNLVIELLSKRTSPDPQQAPILQTVEIIQEREPTVTPSGKVKQP